jgi:hypothetical protein
MDIAGIVMGYIVSTITMIANIFSIKKHGRDLKKSKNGSDKSKILYPTLYEYHLYRKSAKTFEEVKNRKYKLIKTFEEFKNEEEKKKSFGSWFFGPAAIYFLAIFALYYLYSCWFMLKIFRLPILRGSRLDSSQIKTPKRLGLIFRLSGVLMWVTLFSHSLLLYNRGYVGFNFYVLNFFIPPIVSIFWAALWKRILKVNQFDLPKENKSEKIKKMRDREKLDRDLSRLINEVHDSKFWEKKIQKILSLDSKGRFYEADQFIRDLPVDESVKESIIHDREKIYLLRRYKK